MRLDSFTVGYSHGEDRLLLQAIGAGDTQSYWLTRRAVLMMAEGITNVLAEQHQKYGRANVRPEHLADVLGFDQIAAAQSNPLRPGTIDEAGSSAPILLYRMSYTVENAENCIIKLTDADGRGHGYRLTADMLHALMNLIQSQCDKAGWGIQMISQPTRLTNPNNCHALH